jgi:hypothetical protein
MRWYMKELVREKLSSSGMKGLEEDLNEGNAHCRIYVDGNRSR